MNNKSEGRRYIPVLLITLGIVLMLVTGRDALWSKVFSIGIYFLMAMLVAWILSFFSGQSSYWQRVKIPFAIILYLGIVIQVADANYRGSSGSAMVHTCTYCNNHYNHYGYYHLENDCVKYSSDPGFDDHCSVKCCSEDWDTNGHGKYRRKIQ